MENTNHYERQVSKFPRINVSKLSGIPSPSEATAGARPKNPCALVFTSDLPKTTSLTLESMRVPVDDD